MRTHHPGLVQRYRWSSSSSSAEYCRVIARTSVHMPTLDRASHSYATSSHQHARQMIQGKQGLFEMLIVCTQLLNSAAAPPASADY